MTILLSGAKHPNSDQRDVTASTGGYISVTPVPNGAVNALFDDVSCYGINKKAQDTVGVFLKNDSNQTYENVVLQQIYHHNFGEVTKCVKFNWAAVEPKDNNYIENIRSRKNQPFNADFFDPVAKREFALLKILTAGQAGDVIEVLGETAILMGSEKSDVVFAIVEAFEDSLDYNVEAKDDETIYIERKKLIFTNASIELTTPGNATAEPVDFSGGVDEGVLLIEKLAPGETIGLWIQRKLVKAEKISCEYLNDQYNELFGDEFSEERVDDHLDNEECHEVIFSWD